MSKVCHKVQVAGVTLNSPFALTDEQHTTLKALIRYLHQGVLPSNLETYLLTLSGSAGTGKTSLLKLLIQYNNRLGRRKRNIIAAALTHKARKVLDHTINKNAFIKIPTATIAALLKKQRQAGFVGTKKFRGKCSIIGDYDLVIIDEVSMVADRDFNQIVHWAQLYGTKILFIGDPAQIPHPTQELVDFEGKMEKKDSVAFTLKNRLHLEKVMRQGEGNPILDICGTIRKDVRTPTDLYEHKTALNEKGEGVRFTTDPLVFAEAIKEFFTAPGKTTEDILQGKIIVYTNQAVEQYNHLVRNLRFPLVGDELQVKEDDPEDFYLNERKPFIKGDILMGYENVGFPTPFIENGQEYVVLAARRVDDHMIPIGNPTKKNIRQAVVDFQTTGSPQVVKKDMLGPAEGYMVIIQEKNRGTDGEIISGNTTTVFFPDIYAESNYEIFQELLRRADRVNRYGSTVEDFKKYQCLKEQLLFLESLYKWKGEIVGEVEFKRKHPLLQTRIVELIKEELIMDTKDEVKGSKRKLEKSKLFDEIEEKYPGLVINRLRDANVLGDSEELKDIYKILTQDLKYGTSATSHKSQASTYSHVFIDETDFDKIQDRWSYKHNKQIRGSKERNQLKYVAFSRASKNVMVLHN